MLVNGQTPEKRADYNRQYKAIPENMAKIRARAVLRNALRVGTMVRQPCRQCGAEKTHGHHEDYSKPLDVCWLCHTCHVAEHRKTHCKRGHALTADNIYVVRSKRPYRKCRQCQREQYQQFKISRIA